MIGALTPRLRAAVSPYTGIVRSVEECLRSTSDPALFEASCELGDAEGLLGISLGYLTGIGGCGKTRAEAASAAAGEAIERYSASYVPRERLVVAAARELPEAVAPDRFALFTARQLGEPSFRYRPFTAATRIAWVEARELPGGGPAYVPAELVYLGPATLPGLQPVAYATSSGLACGETVAETLVCGLCELLERDAFMIVWTNRLSLPLLETAGDAAAPDVFERTGLEHSAVDLSAFHRLPTVLGIVRAPAGFPGALGVGAAAAPTAERARWKALSEAFASRAAGAKLALLRPASSTKDPVATFDDHIRHYADHRHSGAAAFLDSSPVRTAAAAVVPLEGGNADERIEALCRRLATAGSSAYAVDVTSPDVAALGLAVTRVIAPELCRLDSSHAARFLGGRRLYESAAALGLRPLPLTEHEVNPDPHPFP